MNTIQLLLIGGSAFTFVIYLRRYRSQFIDRAAALLLFITAVFFIIVPNASTAVAHLLGVGRGVDLILYLFIIGATFMVILAFSRISRLEQSLTELARSAALERPRKPDVEV